MKVLIATLLLFISTSCQRQDFDKVVDDIARSNNFSGSILLAIDDSIIVNNAYGFSDKENEILNNPNTIFPIASITKLFIKQAILQLKDNQRLSLDDTLSKYCDLIKFADSVTLSDLLYHKSGIPDIHNRIQHFNRPEELQDSISTTELLNMINSFERLEFKPGSQVSYSNSNYLILTYIIEKLTNKPLDIYLNETIFLPYSMTHTGLYKYYSTRNGNTAGFYNRNNSINFVQDFNFTNFWGSGNAYSTTQDLFYYYRNSHKYLKSEISSHLVQHSGYYLGFRSYYKVIPEIGLAAIILSNNGDFNINLIINEFIEYVKKNHLNSNNQNINLNKSLIGSYQTIRNGNAITIEVTSKKNEFRINKTKLFSIGTNKFLMDNNSLTSISFNIKENNAVELIMNDNGEILVFCKQ
jgi:CubicO group peptidase (beta-lactamase class C family)